MKRNNWSLKNVFAILKVMLMVITFACAFFILINYSSTRHFTQNAVKRYDLLYRVFEYNDLFRSMANECLFASDDTYEQLTIRYRTVQADFEAGFELLMESAELKSTIVHLNGLHNMFYYYYDSINRLMESRFNGDKSGAYEIYTEVSHRSDLIKDVMLRYHMLYSNDVTYFIQKGLSDYAGLQKILICVSGLIMVIVLIALSYMLHLSQNSIAFLMKCTEQIAVCDYPYVRQQSFSAESDWGRLGIAIQSMSARIEYYIEEMEEKNRLSMKMVKLENERLRMFQCAREAEFKVLHNQMSPHFIYNTLNIALQLANDEKAAKTAKMMSAIVDFLRYYTKSASSIIDLNSEVQFVKDYLYICQMRFGQRITFSVHESDDVPNIKLPAVTIQPLVENAVIHGLRDCTENGSVAIVILKMDETVIISVEDNGRGINYEELEELISVSQDGPHVGLRNVKERLSLFFGEQASLSVESQLGCGTVVTIRIPLAKKQKG